MTNNTRIFLIRLTIHWLVGIGLLVFAFACRADPEFAWPFIFSLGFFLGTALSTQSYFAHFCANTQWLENLRATPRQGLVWAKKGPIL